MTILDKRIDWMKAWCKKEGLILDLEGECGFGRECVGVISADETYPDYLWYDEEYDHRIDNNGEVWKPKNAYHKHPCVIVLGRGKDSIYQLYHWLKWFEANDFHYECTYIGISEKDRFPDLTVALGRDYTHRMIKKV